MGLMTVLDVVASPHLRCHLCPCTLCDRSASWQTTSVLMNTSHSPVLWKDDTTTLGCMCFRLNRRKTKITLRNSLKFLEIRSLPFLPGLRNPPTSTSKASHYITYYTSSGYYNWYKSCIKMTICCFLLSFRL